MMSCAGTAAVPTRRCASPSQATLLSHQEHWIAVVQVMRVRKHVSARLS